MANRLIKVKKTYVFPIFVLVTLVMQFIAIFALLIQSGLWANLSRRPVPTLVQLVDGRAIQVGPSGHLDRSPETIRRFVNETLTLMFSWSGVLPPSNPNEYNNPKPDPGISTTESGVQGRITTSSWQAGFALAEKFRKPFLETVAKLTPGGVFDEGKGVQSTFIINYISFPEPVGAGRWKVKLISNLVLITEQDKLGSPIPFNKEVFIAAVDPPTDPLGDNSSPLQKVVYRIRQAGLEIYSIRDLSQEEL
jgi:hypothetical protein